MSLSVAKHETISCDSKIGESKGAYSLNTLEPLYLEMPNQQRNSALQGAQLDEGNTKQKKLILLKGIF